MAKLKTLNPRLSVVSGSRLAPPPKVENWGQGRGGRPWRRLRAQILLRDLYTCRHCGRVCADSDLVADHIVNLAQGGADSPDNLQALCTACHKIKTLAESRAGGGGG